jgi:hypothetical protein
MEWKSRETNKRSSDGRKTFLLVKLGCFQEILACSDYATN